MKRIRSAKRTSSKKPGTASSWQTNLAQKFVLKLFVAGVTARSRQAVLSVRELCAGELKGTCRLEVVDIYQQPALARKNQILATPTLVQSLPKPARKFVGNLTDIRAHFQGLFPTEKLKAVS